MRTITKLLAAPLALLVFAGCSNEMDLGSGIVKEGTITASFEQGNTNTRVAIGTDNALTWTEGDAFQMFYSDNSAASFTLDKGAGTATGTFKGTTSSATVVGAAYPATTDGTTASLSGNTLTMKLASSITLDATENKCNLPMYAAGASPLQFNHLGAALRVNLNGLPEGTSKITVTASNAIAGTFTATIVEDNTPVAEPVLTSTSTAEPDKQVVVNFTEVTAENVTASANNKVVYIPLPTGTYASLKITLGGGIGYTERSITWTNKTIARAKIYNANVNCTELEASTAGDVETALSAALTEQTSGAFQFDITGTVNTSSDAEIIVPQVANTEVTLNFAENTLTTTESAPLTIKTADANSEVKEAENKIVVSAPVTNAHLTIEAPTTTVELNTTAASASYAKVTAKTATTTLVVGSNVTIANLVVNGGNVKAESGSNITITENNTSGIVYVINNGGTVTADGVSGIAFVNSEEEANLRMALADATTASYELKSDIAIATPLVVTKEFALDLGAYNITPSGTSLAKPVLPNPATLSVQGLVNVTVGGKLTLTGNGSIDTGENASITSAIIIIGDNGDSSTTATSLTIDGPTLKGYNFAVTGNGTVHNTAITIENGNFEGYAENKNYGIYHPQAGTLTINGGTFNNGACAVEMRSGTLTINGGTFTSTGNPKDGKPNGSGTTVIGAAISVSQHTTNKELELIIPETSTAEFNGLAAIWEEDFQDTNVSGISMKIKGGKFNGEIYSENCKNFITGGTFDDPSALAYLAEGTKMDLTLEKDIVNTAFGYTVPANTTVNLNLNGHDITVTVKNDDAFEVHGTLTINGEGKITANGGGSNYAIWARNNAVVTLNNGTYFGEGACIQAKESAQITINGGYYSTTKYNDKYFVLNLQDNNSNVIEVAGGTFKGFDPADAKTEPTNPFSMLAEGYESYVSKAATETELVEYSVKLK